MSEVSNGEINFVKGEKVVVDLYLEKSTLPRTIDLTSFDEFKILLPTEASGGPLEITQDLNANDSVLEKIAPDTDGHLRLTLDPIDSNLIKQGFGQDYSIERDNSITPNKKIIRVAKGLTVEDNIS